MFDFEEIEEVAPAAKDAAAPAGTAQRRAPGGAGPPGAARPAVAGGPEVAGAASQDEAAPDEDAFEEASAAKQKWLAAGSRSLLRRGDLAEARKKVAALKEAIRDAWYDGAPEDSSRLKSRLSEAAEDLEAAEEALGDAEEEEQECERRARCAQKKAAEIQKAREAEVDREVHRRMHAGRSAASTVPVSRWLPAGASAVGTKVNLFCFFGIGREARQYQQWAAIARRAYPSISVCPVELPGRGGFATTGVAQGNAHALAETFAREALDPTLSDGLPFALLGCCSGARLAYEVARRRAPVRLYVAGRAAPHTGARGEPQEEHGDPVAPATPDDLVSARLCAAGQGWSGTAQSEAALADLEIGWTPLRHADGAGRTLPVRPRCRIRVYESDGDTQWPPSVIRHDWNLYAPAAGGRCKKKTYKMLSHDELCSASGAPLLLDVLDDLRELLNAPAPA